MPIRPLLAKFFYSLADKLNSNKEGPKVFFKSPSGQVTEAPPKALIKIGKDAETGDVNVDFKNINLSLSFGDPNDDANKQSAKEILGEIGNAISNHSGIALGLDEGITISQSTPLNDVQREQIKIFKEAGWDKRKIKSIRLAYKIINLEDTGAFDKSQELMKSAFNGKMKYLNRKFYNLARAGYLEGFALDLKMSGQLRSDEAVSKILDYFSKAIFLDDGFEAALLVPELEKREKENVSFVSVFARGAKRISLMNEGYTYYLRRKIEAPDGKTGKARKMYITETKSTYKIGPSDGERMDLILRDVVIRDF